MIEEDISTIEKTRQEFKAHREVVNNRVREFEEREINVRTLSGKDRESLDNLRIIEGFLGRALEEHQNILSQHFDLKSLYDMELENYSNMTMVQRFHFRSELYDRVVMDAALLENVHNLFQPLFFKEADKIYNPNKAFEYQKRIRKSEQEEETLELGLDEEEYRKEHEKMVQEKLKKYHDSLSCLVGCMVENNKISLSDIRESVFLENKDRLFPTVEIFREIMIELLTANVIDLEILKKEHREYFWEVSEDFQLNEMLLEVIEENQWNNIKKIVVMPAENKKKVYFEQVRDEKGEYKNIKCSDVVFWYEE